MAARTLICPWCEQLCDIGAVHGCGPDWRLAEQRHWNVTAADRARLRGRDFRGNPIPVVRSD